MEALEPPTLRREGSDYVFEWDGHSHLTAVVRDVIPNTRDGPRGEVVVRDQTGHIHAAMLNLLSTSGKASFVRACQGRDPEFNWVEMVEQFTVLAVETLRDGEPLELLEPQRRVGGRQYAVAPLVPKNLPTLLFGDGAAGKSLLALAICRAVATGEPLAGMEAQSMTPAYLDWEWDADEHQERLFLLGADCTMIYQHCAAPLHTQVRSLGRKLDKAGVDFLVIDSLGLACGGDPQDPQVVLAFFGALRALNRTALIIHHVPKDKKEPFGSAYIRNSVRSAWFILRSQAAFGGEFIAALRHRKTNFGQFEKDIGLRFSFTEDSVTINTTEGSAVPEIAEGMPLRKRMYDYLEAAQVRQSAQEISDALEVSLGQVKVRLTEMKKVETVFNVDGQWGLASRREDYGDYRS